MRAFILACAFVLAGCQTQPRVEVVVETKYVVRTASETQKKLPSYPEAIDPLTANQLELATWIGATEKRMMDLEAIILELVSFYEKPVKDVKEVK